MTETGVTSPTGRPVTYETGHGDAYELPLERDGPGRRRRPRRRGRRSRGLNRWTTIWPFKNSELSPVIAFGCLMFQGRGRTSPRVRYVLSRLKLTSGEMDAGARCLR